MIGRQHWLRGRDRILRLFADPDNQASYPFETEFFGIPYSGNLANFLDWTVFFYGAHAVSELQVLAAVAKTLRNKGREVNFFDVGANVGHHSLFMSQHADRIFAFEPFGPVRAEMTRKLRHAAVTNVTIFPVALGEEDQTGSFHAPTGANQGTGTLAEALPENASDEPIAIRVVRGDSFLAANNAPPVSLMKIDVEGYEKKVLKGLCETLQRDRPPIVMEVQRPPRSGFDSCEDLRSLLYPDHLLFELKDAGGKAKVAEFSFASTDEVLVLPEELAKIAEDLR
jgi:FkbM family methyltransferase